jgi:hypothetical protein
MKYIIARPINGISLNGDEYALDENGDVLTFSSVSEAKQFLYEHGGTPESIDEDIANGAISIIEEQE